MSFGARCSGLEREESRWGGELWPVRRTTTARTRLCSLELDLAPRKEKAGREEKVPCSREDKGGAQTPRNAGMSDAWRSSPASTVAGVGMGKTVKTLELSLLTRLNDFNSSLTR